MIRSEHRLHPVALLIELGGHLRQLALAGLAAFFAARSSGAATEIAGAIAVVPIVLVSISKVLSFRYSLDGGELMIRWGILFRTERHIPFGRIQNLDANETVVHRMTGTVAVVVETGSAGETEASMPALPRHAFDDMRQRIFAERASDRAPSSDVPRAEATEGEVLVTLSTRELILAGLLHGHGWIIVGAIATVFYQFGPGDEFVGRWLDRTLSPAGPADLPRLVVTVVAFVLGFAILMRIFSVLVAVVRYHEHEVRLVGRDLRTTRGLLTRVHTTTPLRRIQTVTIRTGPLHRRVGRVRVLVSTAGGTGTEASMSRSVLAPLLREEEVHALLGRLLPGVSYPSGGWEHAHPRAAGRALRRGLLLGAPFVLTGWVFGPVGVAVAGIVPLWFMAVGYARVRRFGYHATDGVLILTDGWLWRRVIVVRPDRMQSVSRTRSPFDRRAGMARLGIDTAGQGGESIHLPHLGVDRAESLAELYYSAAAGSAFRS